MKALLLILLLWPFGCVAEEPLECSASAECSAAVCIGGKCHNTKTVSPDAGQLATSGEVSSGRDGGWQATTADGGHNPSIDASSLGATHLASSYSQSSLQGLCS